MSENESASAPAYRYTPELAGRIEETWQRRWHDLGTFDADNPVGDLAGPLATSGADKYFVMDMFPYPSGKGLHVGHPLGYIATDVIARHHRMLGQNVLYTLGYDAFGLPAEQYAIATGTHPRETTEQNIEIMSAQIAQIGLSHDERRRFATTDPTFVKWTQWIFLQIFNSWFDPFVPGPDGSRGKARPIVELAAALKVGERDPFSLSQALGITLPDAWEARRPAGGAAVPADWNDGLTAAQIRDLIDAFRLAYISETPVNWAPGLGTVLANEEVTSEGRSERGNMPVFKRSLRQWNMRITAYADRLIDDLERVDWPESVKSMQRHWIGRSHGAEVTFRIDDARTFDVFTTRVDTLFGATFCVLAPEHALLDDLESLPAAWPEGTDDTWTGGYADPRAAVHAYKAQAAAKGEEDRTSDDRTKTGVFTGLTAENPMDGRRIPVFTADYVLTGYGTGAIMAVPAEDERDYAFADTYHLPVIRTIQPPEDFEEGQAYTGDGEKINSRSAELDLNGMSKDEAKDAATAYAEQKGFGRGTTTYRLRDWLFSRQRYWGEPFPIVYAEDAPDVPVALPDEMLPVDLPEVDDFSPKTFDPDDAESDPQTPLSRNEDWVNVRLDLGDGEKLYRRETNTMPNWAGSSAYELRYTDPTNTEKFTDPANEAYWMGPRADGQVGGVDLYIGGVEHAVLHLLYARFWHKILFDLGHISSQEPFHRLFNQGYVQAYAYVDARGVYVPAAEVESHEDGTFTYRGEPVTQEYGKMGKSLKNMVTPDEICRDYGADTFRVYEMSMGPLDVSRPWETRAVVGAQRFLQRLWRLAVDEATGETTVDDEPASLEVRRALHRTIAGVADDMDNMRFNTVVAKLIELVNLLTKTTSDGGAVPREAIEPLVLMVAPLAPHLAEELWQRLGHAESLAREPFPEADPEYLVQETVTCVVQVKGKVKHRIEVSPDITEDELEQRVLAEDRVKELIGSATLRKVIVRAPKLVNLVF